MQEFREEQTQEGTTELQDGYNEQEPRRDETAEPPEEDIQTEECEAQEPVQEETQDGDNEQEPRRDEAAEPPEEDIQTEEYKAHELIQEETQDSDNEQELCRDDKTEPSVKNVQAHTYETHEPSEKKKTKSGKDNAPPCPGIHPVRAFWIILLFMALFFSFSGWKWYNELNLLKSEWSQTQTELSKEKEYASSLESRTKYLEERAAAAEQQVSDLKRQLDEVQTKLNNIKVTQTKNALTAKPVPSQSVPSASSGTDGSSKLIALTFDDGPSGLTGQLLDELKAHGMKATFFVVGNRAAKYPDVLRRMVREGHEIGDHTYDHVDLTKLTEPDIKKTLLDTSETIEAACGVAPVLMRPPGGNYNAEVKSVAAELGMRVIYWSVDTRDWQSRNVDSIMTKAFQSGPYGIRDGAVVLMHDVYSSTISAAVRMMDRLQKEGYRTVTVSELLALRENGGQPGQVYTCAAR